MALLLIGYLVLAVPFCAFLLWRLARARQSLQRWSEAPGPVVYAAVPSCRPPALAEAEPQEPAIARPSVFV